MTRILITGGGGQVGRALRALDWAGADLLVPPRAALDIADGGAIEALFAGMRIDAVVNAAGYTAVDRAEAEPAEAFAANAIGPANLAAATGARGIPLIHISTDYVFSGDAPGLYTEHDRTDPRNVYGASKAAGEVAVMAGNPRSVVLRTAWLVGAHSRNFLTTMLQQAATGGTVEVVDDQFGCPTSVSDLAEALRTIAARMIADRRAPAGIFHFVNAGEASWHELAVAIFAEAGLVTPVRAVTTAARPTPAQRPANSRLATGRIAADYGLRPRHWRAAVAEIVSGLRAQAAVGVAA